MPYKSNDCKNELIKKYRYYFNRRASNFHEIWSS